jgi:Fe-S oxidoreductases
LNGKLCTFDCIYCECGYNSEHRGGKFSKKEDVVRALNEKLHEMSDEGKPLDVITFAGNGEPTLHPDFPEIIDATLALRDRFYPQAKVSVLSNSTRIDHPEVRAALLKVDNNILKLDSAFQEKMELIDGPVHADFTVDKLVDNLCLFNGNLIIQSMFLRGKHRGIIVDNTTDADVKAWVELLKRIRPKQVMVYSLDRPTPEQNLEKIEHEELERIAQQARDAGLYVTVA